MSKIRVIHLPGLTPYENIETSMKSRASEISESQDIGEIWLVEHDHVYTRGVSGDDKDIINTGNTPVYESSRGGKHTYHGPGQRVIYTILNLKKLHQEPDVRKFVNQLEDWIISSLSDAGINAFKTPDRIGIWVNNKGIEQKIASIGIKLHKWVSYHGISINVNTDLSYFNGIIPCGLKDYKQCSLRSLGIDISLEDMDNILKTKLVDAFSL